MLCHQYIDFRFIVRVEACLCLARGSARCWRLGFSARSEQQSERSTEARPIRKNHQWCPRIASNLVKLIRFLFCFYFLVDRRYTSPLLVLGPNGGSKRYREEQLSRCAEIFFKYVRYPWNMLSYFYAVNWSRHCFGALYKLIGYFQNETKYNEVKAVNVYIFEFILFCNTKEQFIKLKLSLKITFNAIPMLFMRR